MLTDKQQGLYDAFYDSTHDNEFLDERTEILLGLASAMAMNCSPCAAYYLKQAKQSAIPKGYLSETIAKVMAVAAGQKRLQAEDVFHQFKISLDDYD